MKTPQFFYLRKRINPQFNKPYYVGHGQISKKEAKKYEAPGYGDNYMIAFSSEAEYNAERERLKSEGFSVR